MNSFVSGRGGLKSTMLPEICFVSGAARCLRLFSFPVVHDLCQLLCVQAFLGTLVSANNFESRSYNVNGEKYVMAAKAKAKAKTKKTKTAKAEAEAKTQNKLLPQAPAILTQVKNMFSTRDLSLRSVFHHAYRKIRSFRPNLRLGHPPYPPLFPASHPDACPSPTSTFATPFLHPCLPADLVISPLLLLLLLILLLLLLLLLSSHLMFFCFALHWHFLFFILFRTGCCLVAFCEVLTGFVACVVILFFGLLFHQQNGPRCPWAQDTKTLMKD